MNTVYSATDLKYTYRGALKKTLEFPALDICEGENIVLTGPSGAGKTTFLRLIAGSYTPHTGIINKTNTCSIIYQDLRLVEERTVLENVLSGAFGNLSPWSLKFSNEQVDFAEELIRSVGLQNEQSSPVSQLSGGQKQRVAIARALISQPKILLGDECFSHLDKQTSFDIFNLILELQKQYRFCFVVTQHEDKIPKDRFDRHIHFANQEKTLTKNPGRSLAWIVAAVFLGLLLLSINSLHSYTLDYRDSFLQLKNIIIRFIPWSFEVWQNAPWTQYFNSLVTTMQMALVGSSLGFLIAAPLSVLSVNAFTPNWLAQSFRFALMALRAVPALVWAIVFVAAIGIGPAAGALALAAYSAGFVGKLMYESLESVEMKSFMSLRGLGASRWQAFVSAIWPTAKTSYLGHFIFNLEYNIRSASIMGLVGAGGIGQELSTAIEWRRFENAGVILLILLLTIFSTDKISEFARKSILKIRGD